tara:strand:+ start:594 stop:1124 length:531 start_codon:yes stop_codon:yes gene_type:complete
VPGYVPQRDLLPRRNNISESRPPLTIISGGQTGVDRAALDVALEFGVPHAGWCPRGRRAEDGPISTEYLLRESPTPEYSERTFLNIQDSDGTLILHRGKLAGGTLLTHQLAHRIKIPLLVIQVERVTSTRAIDSLFSWLQDNSIQLLNVAGPRESRDPGIYQQAGQFLRTFFSACA